MAITGFNILPHDALEFTTHLGPRRRSKTTSPAPVPTPPAGAPTGDLVGSLVDTLRTDLIGPRPRYLMAFPYFDRVLPTLPGFTNESWGDDACPCLWSRDLLRSIAGHFDEIEREVAAASALRDKPAGTVRITTVEHAAQAILWPALAPLLAEYPDINVEIISDYAVTDIVAERFDAGVRLGEQVDRDMIAVRIGPDFHLAIVGAPSYFESRAKPLAPQDLAEHSCIGLRLPTHGGLYSWEFRKGEQEVKVRVHGRAVFNTLAMMRQAALDGLGLASLPEDIVELDLAEGRLVQVLDDWCPRSPGYHLYHPSRREPSPAFALVVQALRIRNDPHDVHY